MSDRPLTSEEQDRADMQQLCAGNDAAFNEIIERHAPRLFNYLVRSLQNEDDAADLAQETFARVYQNRATFDPTQKFSVWLYAIASNLVRTQYRYRTRRPTLSLDAQQAASGKDLRETIPDTGATPAEWLQSTETADAVRHAIAELPEELRTPLILFEYETLSHSEIGMILNCTPKAVETRLYRARKHLRSRLGHLL